MAFVPFTKDDQPTMAAFNEKFQQAIDEAVSRGVKIEVGSYVGTGTYGSSNPNSLTFGFEPKFVEIYAYLYSGELITPSYGYNANTVIIPTSILTTSYVKGRGFNGGSSSSSYQGYAKISEDGKTIFWYNTVDSRQFNASGYTYFYRAIG